MSYTSTNYNVTTVTNLYQENIKLPLPPYPDSTDKGITTVSTDGVTFTPHTGRDEKGVKESSEYVNRQSLV